MHYVHALHLPAPTKSHVAASCGMDHGPAGNAGSGRNLVQTREGKN
jgi:hypothetical protein